MFVNIDESLPKEFADLYASVLKAVLTSSDAFKSGNEAALYCADKNGKPDQLYDSYFFYYWVGSIPGDLERKAAFKDALTKIRLTESAWKASARNGIGNLGAAQAAFELSAKYNYRTIQQHLVGYLQYARSEGANLFGTKNFKEIATSLISHQPNIVIAQQLTKNSDATPQGNESAAKNYRQALALKYGYVRSTICAEAIRLIGAGGEAFTTRDVVISTTQNGFTKPADMLPIWTDVLGHVKARALENGTPFHNSLHTRLVDYNVHVVPHTERKQLHLTLGPLYWEEYAVPRWLTDQMSPADITNYVNLEQVAATGRISSSKLHNIFDTATTLATIDGYLLYSRRSRRVSVAEDSFTSCIAENISAEKDESLDAIENAKLPSPFRAAIRGASEELSKGISEYVLGNGGCKLICLGLSFDLQAYHPDMLFFGVLPITFEQVQKLCREDPGEDFFEGQVQGIHLSRIEKEDYGDIALPHWTGDGRASCLRAIEFLTYWAKTTHCELLDVITKLEITSSEFRIV